MTILLTASSNATTVGIKLLSQVDKGTPIRTLFVWGTHGAGTTKLQMSPDNVNWFDVTGASFTANGAINVEFRARWIRAVVSGGTANSVNMELL